MFQGTGDGRFVAYSAETGDVLWETRSQTGIMAPPITYTVDGEQHVAVAAGYGGGLHVSRHASRGLAINETHNEGRVLVFKRGGRAEMPKNAPRDLIDSRAPGVDGLRRRTSLPGAATTTACASAATAPP